MEVFLLFYFVFRTRSLLYNHDLLIWKEERLSQRPWPCWRKTRRKKWEWKYFRVYRKMDVKQDGLQKKKSSFFLYSFYIYHCRIILMVDIKTLDNSMFEKSYFRMFHFCLYTQEPPMLNRKLSKTGFFVRSDEFHLSNTLSYLQISIPKSNTNKRKQNAYLTTAI